MQFLTVLWLLSISYAAEAQPDYEQNLKNFKLLLKEHKKVDSTRVAYELSIAQYYLILKKPDSAISYTNMAEKNARKIGNLRLLAQVFDLKSTVFMDHQGNYPRALHYLFEELKLYERIGDSVKLTTVYVNIASLHEEIGDLGHGIAYAEKAVAKNKNLKPSLKAFTFNILGYLQLRSKLYDQAHLNFQHAIVALNNRKDDAASQYPLSLYGIGKVNFEKGMTEVAQANYREAIKILNRYPGLWSEHVLFTVYDGMGEIFDRRNQSDSAIYYYTKALASSQAQNAKRTEVLRKLALAQRNLNAADGFDTLNTLVALNDSLYNRQKLNEVLNLKFAEEQRQRQILDDKIKSAEDRKHHLQYAAIAIVITTFLLILILLSRSFIINAKWIKVLGIIGLLLFFEFINLLLHPYIAHLTHHSPIGMLAIMVCIAALLVPLHHKVEHWAMHKMIERNKKARLAAAKKILEENEKQTETDGNSDES